MQKHYLAPVPDLDRQLEEMRDSLTPEHIAHMLDDSKYYAAIKAKALRVGYTKLWPTELEFLVEYTVSIHNPVKE